MCGSVCVCVCGYARTFPSYIRRLNWIPNSSISFSSFYVYLHYVVCVCVFVFSARSVFYFISLIRQYFFFSFHFVKCCTFVCWTQNVWPVVYLFRIYNTWCVWELKMVFFPLTCWESDFTDDKNNHQWNIKLLCGYATKFTKYLIYIFVCEVKYCCCCCCCGFFRLVSLPPLLLLLLLQPFLQLLQLLLLLLLVLLRWWCSYAICLGKL